MTDHENRWAAVGAAVKARFDELNLSFAEFERTTGISYKTMKRYINGEPIRRKDKQRALAEGLGWSSDSIVRLLVGRDPVAVVSSPNEHPRVRHIRDQIAVIETDTEEIGDILAGTQIDVARDLNANFVQRAELLRALASWRDGEDESVQPETIGREVIFLREAVHTLIEQMWAVEEGVKRIGELERKFARMTGLVERLALHTLGPDADEWQQPAETRTAE